MNTQPFGSTIPKQRFAKSAQNIFAQIFHRVHGEYRLAYYTYVRWKAEKGDALAQYNLGSMCDGGNGVFQTSVEAFKWYQKAAFQGIPKAQFAVGLKFLSGEGVGRNDAEAFLWFRKAAEQGHSEAQYQIAQMLREGRGVTRDHLSAVKWFRKAAEAGHAAAARELNSTESSQLIPKTAEASPANDQKVAA